MPGMNCNRRSMNFCKKNQYCPTKVLLLGLESGISVLNPALKARVVNWINMIFKGEKHLFSIFYIAYIEKYDFSTLSGIY